MLVPELGPQPEGGSVHGQDVVSGDNLIEPSLCGLGLRISETTWVTSKYMASFQWRGFAPLDPLAATPVTSIGGIRRFANDANL